MAEYTNLIPCNIATAGARRIGIYDGRGNRVGQIPLGHLTPPDRHRRCYSFGAIADLHMGSETGQADFQRALTWFGGTEGVDLVCHAGDITASGTAEEFAQYRQTVAACSPGVPVHTCTGNHDISGGISLEAMEESTGHSMCHSFSHQGDVFIFLSAKSVSKGSLFHVRHLQWLYETLEANRNRRCFLFQHYPLPGGSGEWQSLYGVDVWGGNELTVFESLLRHYKNVILFHGHTHFRFSMQRNRDTANIGTQSGCWSIHIPSLAYPRDGAEGGTMVQLFPESEGYVADVYENGIHLRGRDFVRGQFLPIASYWLDTPLQTIAAGTYSDSTGTITV